VHAVHAPRWESESHVLELLERTDANHGGGWLGLEHHFFFGEGVDALACLDGRLANGGDLEKAGENEFSDRVFLDVTFDHAGKRFENRSHLLAAELGAGCDAVDDLSLRVLVFNGGSFGCHAHGMLETRGDVKPPNDFLSLKNRVFLKGWRREILKKFTSSPREDGWQAIGRV